MEYIKIGIFAHIFSQISISKNRNVNSYKEGKP